MNIKICWMQKLDILWRKIKIKVVSKLVNIFAAQTNTDISNTVLIVGSTRSGTTFLMESLNCDNEYRLIFEPFNSTYTKEWKSFGPRHYIDPDHPNEKEVDAIDKILRGQISNNWVDQFNKSIRSDQRLIKAVRANLLIDYLEQNYPQLRIIYIFRHPYKVVASRINLNFDPKDVYSVLKHELFIEKYYNDIDINFLKSRLSSPESCHTALWCLENRFLLKSQKNRNFIILQYENIVGKTVKLEQDILVESDRQRRPSATSNMQKKYPLSGTEIIHINEILSLFKMEEYIDS